MEFRQLSKLKKYIQESFTKTDIDGNNLASYMNAIKNYDDFELVDWFDAHPGISDKTKLMILKYRRTHNIY